MKKSRGLLAALALTLLCTAARAEGDYVSIREIRNGVPAHWTGMYTDREGSAVSIDTPIVVPQVEAVPVVRITWGGPYAHLDGSVAADENDANHLIAEFSTPANEGVSLETAPEIYEQRLREKLDFFPMCSNIAGLLCFSWFHAKMIPLFFQLCNHIYPF